MRKCMRCNSDMIDNIKICTTEGVRRGLVLRYEGDSDTGSLFGSKTLGQLKSAVCPECGHAEIYLDDTSGVKALVKKHS